MDNFHYSTAWTRVNSVRNHDEVVWLTLENPVNRVTWNLGQLENFLGNRGDVLPRNVSRLNSHKLDLPQLLVPL